MIKNNKTSNTEIKNINNDNITIYCKYCNSDHVIKKGVGYKNKQMYYCKECKEYFRIGDNRIKRDPKQKELALLLYSHNMSKRSIQSTINKYFNTNISFNVVDNWIKTSSKLLNYDINLIEQKNKEKPKSIEVLEMDELYSKYYDLKKNEELKYGLLLTETGIKLLHLK